MNSRNAIKRKKLAKFAKESLNINTLMIKTIEKLKTIVITLENLKNLKFVVPEEITEVYHNRSNNVSVPITKKALTKKN